MKALRFLGCAVAIASIGGIASACSASAVYDAAYDCQQARACWAEGTAGTPVDDCEGASEALYDRLEDDQRARVDRVFEGCRDLEGCAYVDCACRGLGANQGVCAVASCATCAGLSADACAATAGCTVTGSCGGSPSASCATINNPASCLADGCTWSNPESLCSGTPVPCATNATENACQAEPGCTWTAACASISACPTGADSAP